MTPTRGSPFPTPPSEFQYQMEFWLDPDCTTARLSLSMRADDIIGVCQTTTCTDATTRPGVFLNNVAVDNIPGVTFTRDTAELNLPLTGSKGGIFNHQPLGIALTGPVTNAGPFRPGVNFLRISVTDTATVATGLDLTGSVIPGGGSASVGAGVGLSIDVEYITAKRRLQ